MSFKEGDLVITTDEVHPSLRGKFGIITKVFLNNNTKFKETMQVYRMKIFGEESKNGEQEGCFDWVSPKYIRKSTKLERVLK